MIWLVLLLAFVFRAYRVEQYLGFWFDQGRDALAIWDLLKNGNWFLVGPTTGIEGIFLGPFYYYLITPFYWLGKGNPVFPAIFLAALNVGTVYLIYRLTKKYVSHAAGLLAALLYTCSFQLIGYQRWLSNPTPLPFLAMVGLWLILEIIQTNRKLWIWPALGLILGLSLQLEAASAIFFIPATTITFLLNRKSISGSLVKVVLLVGLFGATLLPQLIFNFRNQNILLHSFQKFLVAEKSFQPAVTNFYSQRLQFYQTVLTNKFVHKQQTGEVLIGALVVMTVLIWKKSPKGFVGTHLVWLLTPLVMLLFYHGNKGYVWDYYFTGIFPSLFILVGSIFALFFQHVKSGFRWLPVVLTLVILAQNLTVIFDYYWQRPVAPFIALTQMRQAIEWVYEDSQGTEFNYDVYVPPILYEAYKYVFLWQGETVYKRQPTAELVSRLYTLYEPDGEHPQLLEQWQVRQSTIGSIQETRQFGSITVQRRIRFQ